jgi:hypothetical protein
VRLYLLTAATNGKIVYYPEIYEYEEPRWNDIDKGKPNYEKNLSQFHLVHYTSHMD